MKVYAFSSLSSTSLAALGRAVGVSWENTGKEPLCESKGADWQHGEFLEGKGLWKMRRDKRVKKCMFKIGKKETFQLPLQKI